MDDAPEPGFVRRFADLVGEALSRLGEVSVPTSPKAPKGENPSDPNSSAFRGIMDWLWGVQRTVETSKAPAEGLPAPDPWWVNQHENPTFMGMPVAHPGLGALPQDPSGALNQAHQTRVAENTNDVLAKLVEALKTLTEGGLGGGQSAAPADPMGLPHKQVAEGPDRPSAAVLGGFASVADWVSRMVGVARPVVEKANSTDSIGKMAGGVFGAIGDTAAATDTPEGKGVKVVADLMKQMAESIDTFRSWNSSLHDANVRFAEFSGAMAAVDARQQVRDIELAMARGNRRAEAAEHLAEAKTALEKQVTPWEDAWANVKSETFAALAQQFSRVLGPLNAIAEKFGLIDAEGKDYDLDKEFEKALEAAEKFDKEGRPKKLG